MPISNDDMTKAGWQKKRANFKELKGSGVGEALDKFKADYVKGDGLGPGEWAGAHGKAVAVTNALKVAKKKAETIKDARKAAAVKLVDEYEKAVVDFENLLKKLLKEQTLRKEEEKKREAAKLAAQKQRAEYKVGVTLDKVIADAGLRKVYEDYWDAMDSKPMLALLLWKQAKYKEAALAYGEHNDWNIGGPASTKLYRHYKGTAVLPAEELQALLKNTNVEFGQLYGNVKDFVVSKQMDAFLAAKFPG
jgi:hypothetical protein